MTTDKSPHRLGDMTYWIYLILFIVFALFVTGAWVLLFVLFQMVCFVLVFVVYLLGGWIWYGLNMLRHGPIIWPAVTAFVLAVIAWRLSRAAREPRPEANLDESGQTRRNLLARRLSLTLALLAGVDLAQNLTVAATTKLFGSDGHRIARERTHSKNNLRQIVIGLHNYHQTHTVIPPGATAALIDGSQPGLETHHGWATFLLPYVDQTRLYEQIDFNVAWDDPKNKPAMQMIIPGYINPAVPVRRDENAITYAGNEWLFAVNSRTRIRDVRDGAGNTMFVGEIPSHWRAWGRPGNWRDLRLGINHSVNGFGSPFQGGCHFMLVDGSVRFISENTDPTVLRNFADPQDGETLPLK